MRNGISCQKLKADKKADLAESEQGVYVWVSGPVRNKIGKWM